MRIEHCREVAAPPAAVWALLGEPARWPDFEILVAAVAEPSGAAAAGPAREGRDVLVVARGLGLRAPVRIRAAEPDRWLGLRVRTLPGLVEDVDHLIEPLAGRRCRVRVTVAVRGPLRLVAYLPLRASSALVVRSLVRRAEAEAGAG